MAWGPSGPMRISVTRTWAHHRTLRAGPAPTNPESMLTPTNNYVNPRRQRTRSRWIGDLPRGTLGAVGRDNAQCGRRRLWRCRNSSRHSLQWAGWSYSRQYTSSSFSPAGAKRRGSPPDCESRGPAFLDKHGLSDSRLKNLAGEATGVRATKMATTPSPHHPTRPPIRRAGEVREKLTLATGTQRFDFRDGDLGVVRRGIRA